MNGFRYGEGSGVPTRLIKTARLSILFSLSFSLSASVFLFLGRAKSITMSSKAGSGNAPFLGQASNAYGPVLASNHALCQSVGISFAPMELSVSKHPGPMYAS